MEYKPHKYQKYATQRILDTPNIALLLEMGLGKTVSTLTAIDLLLNDYFDAQKVLVIAPLRVAEDTWTREIEKWNHLKHLSISKILGSISQRRKALKREADIYVINRENVVWLVSELGTSWNFDTVVIDELSSFKSSSSKRFRALRRVRPMMKRVIGLTGTPAPNSLMDLWPQIYLLDKGERLGKTISAYRDRYFIPGERSGHIVYKWHQKKESEKKIYEAISDIAISMKSEDWLTLPPRIDRTVVVKLSAKSKEQYQTLERDLLLPFQDSDVVASTAAVLSNKLLQMASGAVYDEDKGIREIHEGKLDALEDIIESAQGKPVMVFYNFKHSLSRIQKRFPQARILRKGKDGNQDIADWNNDKIEILLLHPKSAGHGLNLQESSCQHVVWYDQIWSLEEYQQANARVHRQGQARSIIIMRIVTQGTLDEDAVAALERKADRQEALMQAVKARIDKIEKV